MKTVPLNTQSPKSRRGCFPGCGCLIVSSLIIVVIGALVWGWLYKGPWETRTQIFAEALVDGDAALAYKNADNLFKKQYSQKQLADYFVKHPQLFKPLGFNFNYLGNFVKGKELMTTRFIVDEQVYAVHTVKNRQQQFQLLGISPDLDAAVPREHLDMLQETDLDTADAL